MSRVDDSSVSSVISNKVVPGPGYYVAETQISHQWERPGLETEMQFEPVVDSLPDESQDLNTIPQFVKYRGNGKLNGKVALITGGDSGIGKAVAVLFAKEGCDIAINYLEAEQQDAENTRQMIEAEGRKCLLLPGDIGFEDNCVSIVTSIIEQFRKIDILVNNAGEQHMVTGLEEMTDSQLTRTFRTNVFGMFLLTKHALPFMQKGSCIINTSSVVAYRGSSHLLDYGATKGAIIGFTRCLAKNLAPRGIRVNAVAPGPVYTALQPISRDAEEMKKWANDPSAPIGRIAQPSEIATSFVFLASNESSQFSGQTLHPNGWEILNT